MSAGASPGDSLEDKLLHQFYSWELRGRGWTVYPFPLSPEPPFRPFHGHFLEQQEMVDDGRKATFLSSLFSKLGAKPNIPPVIAPTEEEPELELLTRDSLVELHASLPADLSIAKESFEQFLVNLSLCREPIGFELLGTAGRIAAQFTAHPHDEPLVRRQSQAHFPEAVFQSREGALEEAWEECKGDEALVVEFGLEREFMLPLASGKLDPFVGIIGALTELQQGELGLFQVLFQPVRQPWAESIFRSVTHSDGSPFFINAPELTGAAEHKVARPLYAAIVRIAVRSDSFERTLQISRDLAGSLGVFANPRGNALIPLENTDYPFEEHIEDMLRRQSRRPGMLLNVEELIGFVHLPTSAVRSAVLERESEKTKAAPQIARRANGLLLGTNSHRGQSREIRLTREQRVRHTHIIGASGTGKSTLLFNLIRQDIENGEGVALLDPHGDLVERILGIIPPARIGDVVLVDPSDEQFSVGFNILSAHSDLEKNLLASDLVSVFQRLSTSWGDQMGSVLQNAILAFLESDQGGTLADLRRFLIEPAYRDKFLKNVRDPDIVYYWRKAFVQLSGNKSIGSVLTRLETFLSPKPIRYMVSQPVNRLDFGQILDTGKIFLAKLPQGQMGKENAFLLGSLLVAKFQQLAMGRQAQQAASRRDFWLYIDEFQNFITPSMAEILSGARKYRLGLILAHQELRQLERDREVSSAVLSNPYTRVVFRIGDADARTLESGFSFFESRDLQNLETGQAICRIEKASGDFNIAIPLFKEPTQIEVASTRNAVIAASRAKYATSRAEVEAALHAKYNAEEPALESPKSPVPISKITEKSNILQTAPAVPEKSLENPPPPSIATSAKETLEEPIESTNKKFREAEALRELGRGGVQHQAIQKRIKEAAEILGFHSTIEQEVLAGKGSVDLILKRGEEAIACEISITTTVDHEVGNVAKCIQAGFTKIAIICISSDRLEKIQAGISGDLGTDVLAMVRFYHPDEFIAYLKSLPPLIADSTAPKTRRGYKIKSSHSAITPIQQKQKEEVAIRAIAAAMRRKSK